MAQLAAKTSHITTHPNEYLNRIRPGTTFPGTAHPLQQSSAPESEILSFDGPVINNRPTTVTCLSPAELEGSPLLASLCDVINRAFWTQKHNSNGANPVPLPRLAYDGQFLDELRNTPGTFTYIIWYQGTDQVVGTTGAKRHYGTAAIVDKDDSMLQREENTWKRFGPLPENTDVWELSMMAVDPVLQRQGLAGQLMTLVEKEVMRRFEVERGESSGTRLLMYCTTIKEVNGAFYLRRGFEIKYEVHFDRGHLDSSTGFTVAHMSKVVISGYR
jgi:GNAT superfamily N-acetyltransferase